MGTNRKFAHKGGKVLAEDSESVPIRVRHRIQHRSPPIGGQLRNTSVL